MSAMWWEWIAIMNSTNIVPISIFSDRRCDLDRTSYGNLLGQTNSEIVFHLIEESAYSKTWKNYPRRRQRDAVPEGNRATAEGAAVPGKTVRNADNET